MGLGIRGRSDRSVTPKTDKSVVTGFLKTHEFVFFEGFVDEAAREVHASAPYHLAMSDAGWACLEGDPTIEFMKPAV